MGIKYLQTANSISKFYFYTLNSLTSENYSGDLSGCASEIAKIVIIQKLCFLLAKLLNQVISSRSISLFFFICPSFLRSFVFIFSRTSNYLCCFSIHNYFRFIIFSFESWLITLSIYVNNTINIIPIFLFFLLSINAFVLFVSNYSIKNFMFSLFHRNRHWRKEFYFNSSSKPIFFSWKEIFIFRTIRLSLGQMR